MSGLLVSNEDGVERGSSRRTAYRRAATLAASVMVSLVSGTNYAVGNYAPQLAKQLRLSSTEINAVLMAGNLGVYISGPIWGNLVDSYGPRLNLACAAVLLLSGYLGIRAYYTDVFAYTGIGSLAVLCLFTFATGAGSSAGLASAVNTAAKSFPDQTRATATGLVLAGFGLSAFLFSTLSHSFFPGNTADFLTLLAFGCFVPMVLGFFLVVPVPPPTPKVSHHRHTDESNWARIASSSSSSSSSAPNGYLPIPDASDVESSSEAGQDDEDDDIEDQARVPSTPTATRVRTHRDGTVLELSPSRSFKSNEGEPLPDDSLTKVISHVSVVPSVAGVGGGGVTGRKLIREGDFWLLAGITSLLSGTGLMWINNCGLSTLALYTKGNPATFDAELLSRLQATQVSTISVWNCAGRILIGILTDVAKHRFAIRRIWFMSLVASLFILSQTVALYTTDVGSLWIVSSLLGLAYGGLFGLAPVVCLEWFGLDNFSLNWGFVSMSPILGGNVANFVFGRVYDSHTVGRLAKAALALVVRSGPILDPSDKSHDCYLGQACYVEALHVTLVATTVALALSLFAAYRRERRSRERKRRTSNFVVGA